MNADKMLREKEVKELTGLSRSTRWRLQRKGLFPQNVQISVGLVGVRQSEVVAWMDGLKRVGEVKESA